MDKLFAKGAGAFTHPGIAQKARQLAYGNLACLGRHTVAGMLTASGRQFTDWTCFYRLFSEQRVHVKRLNEVCIESAMEELTPNEMVVAHMDDTILKKTGKKITGTSWRRDPLSPPFHTNFIWGQRFIQLSLTIPDPLASGPSQSRAIPIGLHHCPTPKKPVKTATEEQIQTYKEVKKQSRLSLQGSLKIKALREHLDRQDHQARTLCIGVDGSYTNSTVLKNLPERTALIGRIRKDAKLYGTANQQQFGKGRKKVYGDPIPTPEQIRQSSDYKWQQVEAWAAGKKHRFDVKVVKNLKSRTAGQQHLLQLMVVRPLAYRPNSSSKLLYRKPAYLICTDNNMDAQTILQNYIWRWEIEVNIRDEKTLMGCGQAQVSNEHSATDVPAFVSAMYAFLLLANIKAFKKNGDSKNRDLLLPRPKWYPAKKEQRFTTGDLVNHLRTELWAKAVGCGNFSSFVKQQHTTKSRRNKTNDMTGALFYSRR